MRTLKTLFVVLALAVLTVTGLGLSRGIASAATPTVDPDGKVCGPRYALLESIPLKDKAGKKGGDLKVYWSEYHQENCALTKASQDKDVRKHMMVNICYDRCSKDNPNSKDAGKYFLYAGPVYMVAPGHCVEVQGQVDKVDGGDPYVGSKRGWCGVN